MQALAAVLQGLQSYTGTRHGAQVELLMQGLDPLPGQLVFLMGCTPLFALLLQPRVVAAFAQLEHPVDGLLDHSRARIEGCHAGLRL
ncbi:hypothetical protein D3C75_1193110 [compost metagenome]